MIWLILLVLVFVAPIYSVVMFFPFKLKGKSKKYKVCTIGLYALCNLVLEFNMIYSMAGFKNISNEMFNRVVLLLAAVYFIISMYGALFLVIRQIIVLISSRFNYRKSRILSKIHNRKCVYIILAVMIIFGLAGYINAGIIKVKTYDISIDKKSDKGSCNIIMITDTHMGTGDNKRNIDNIAEKVNEIKPDFVFLTGDIIDENTSDENVDYILKTFSNMKSSYGTYGVLGNHEGYRQGDSAFLFKKYGIKLLRDEVKKEAGINIIGRKDYYDKRKEIKQIIDENNIDSF